MFGDSFINRSLMRQ